LRLLPRSAAYRIGLLSAAAFALSTLAIGLAIYFAVHRHFQQQLDDSIRQATASLMAEYSDDGGDGLEEALALRERSTGNWLGFAVFASDGRRVAGALNMPMPPVGWHSIVFDDPIEGPDPARALTTALPDGNRLVVAADLEPLEHMDDTILSLLALGFGAVLILGAAFAVFLGRYLQRRLDAIAKGSLAFAAGDFSGRAQVSRRGDEFDQLAMSLNAMLDHIETLLLNLRQVTSDLAHDMRTPLTHLRGQLDELLATPPPDRDQQAEEAIEKCDDILRLFAAILRISELEAGELSRYFKPVDIAELVLETAETYEPLAEESNHALEVSIPETGVEVRGDRQLLAQALINLIENALHHTPPGSTITIEAGHRLGFPYLLVRDDGPGISQEDRPRATERFVRLDAARSTPGNGLGLSLVKAIAAAHCGRLELSDAAPGLAATITFDGGDA
jgi:hypothetical protein